MQVSIDQEVMLDSRNTTHLFLNRVISDVERRNENTDLSEPVVFVGRPSDNPIFRAGFQIYSRETDSGYGRAVGSLWNIANSYTHYGEFWLGGNCGVMSYIGLLRDCGVNYELVEDDKIWNEICKREEVVSMPAYPYDGYITHINNITVIKLSQ